MVTDLGVGSFDDDEAVFSGNDSETSPRAVELADAVYAFHDTLTSCIGVVVGVVEACDSDGVAYLDTSWPFLVVHCISDFELNYSSVLPCSPRGFSYLELTSRMRSRSFSLWSYKSNMKFFSQSRSQLRNLPKSI